MCPTQPPPPQALERRRQGPEPIEHALCLSERWELSALRPCAWFRHQGQGRLKPTRKGPHPGLIGGGPGQGGKATGPRSDG
eukprot:6115178-Alexandrium_andersonii.AAC.1